MNKDFKGLFNFIKFSFPAKTVKNVRDRFNYRVFPHTDSKGQPHLIFDGFEQ